MKPGKEKNLFAQFILLLGLIILYLLVLDAFHHNRRIMAIQDSALRSKAWLDALRVDPFELRSRGIKGKKKLGELFDAYNALYRLLPAKYRPSLDSRFEEIYAITQQPEFHDLGLISEEQFNEDSTSYLRLCYQLSQRGFNTEFYRSQILRILPRLNHMMPSRGVNQQMTFHKYYKYFGLAEPFPLNSSYASGVISSRAMPEAMNNLEAYNFTHEIFAVFEFQGKTKIDFFNKDDKIYIQNTLRSLALRYIQEGNLDLTAEIVMCMGFFKMQREISCLTAVDFILSSQNPDGSFGDYQELRPIFGEFIQQRNYLHTTEVVLLALSLFTKGDTGA